MPASPLNTCRHKGLRTSVLSLSILTSFLGNFNLSARAAEISLVQGLYQGSKVANGLASSHVQIGGRYSLKMRDHLHFYSEGNLSFKRYSDAGPITPKNTNDVTLGAGGRYYFDPFNPRFIPYASIGITLGSESSAEQTLAGSIRTSKEAGLFYHGAMGLRVSLSPRFFLDLESNLFKSSFTSTKKERETILSPTGVVEASSSTQKNALYVNSSHSLSDIKLAIGMRL